MKAKIKQSMESNPVTQQILFRHARSANHCFSSMNQLTHLHPPFPRGTVSSSYDETTAAVAVHDDFGVARVSSWMHRTLSFVGTK